MLGRLRTFFCPPDVVFISDNHVINATSLSKINWKLNVLAPLSYHRLLLKILNLPNMRVEEEGVSEEIEKIVNQTQCDYNFLGRRPSEIAVAAILVVYNHTNPEQPTMEEAATELLTLIKEHR